LKCAIVYFSGTGNSAYIANVFKINFEKYNVETNLIDICEIEEIEEDYDYYVFGAPIHAECYPINFSSWMRNNLKSVDNKKTIIFSTQASSSAVAGNILKDSLEKKGYSVSVIKPIQMPNNYYTVMFKKESKEEVEGLKENAHKTVKALVDRFLMDGEILEKSSRLRKISGTIAYNCFYLFSKRWAKRRLKVDMDKCIGCNKCIDKCPVSNIYMDKTNIKFKESCISCQRCIHICPVNAYKYKGDDIEQYII
jgi:ferredoxin/flavodoxin